MIRAGIAATVMVTAMALVCQGQEGTTASDDANKPLFRVAGRYYSMKDLFGITEGELKVLYLGILKDVEEDELKRRAGSRVPAGDAVATRADYESLLYESYRSGLIISVARLIVLASITDKIMTDHGESLDDYVDVAMLRAALNREAEFLRFLRQHADKDDQDMRLYKEAVDRYQCTWTVERWQNQRRHISRVPIHQADGLERAAVLGDYIVKGLVAHHLLKDATEKGIFYRRGAEVVDFDRSVLTRITVGPYLGDTAMLQRYLEALVDDKGNIVRGRAILLSNMSRTLGADIAVMIEDMFGRQQQEDGGAIPEMGKVYESAPSTYCVYGWKDRVVSGSQNSAAEATFNNLATGHLARTAALALFAPEFKSYVKGWEPAIDELAMLSIESRFLFSWNTRYNANFIKKSYPGDRFALWEAEKGRYQDAVVEVVRVIGSDDVAGAKRLVQQVNESIDKAATDGIRKRYEAVREALVGKFPELKQ
jgi:hypothetical protein